MSIEFENGSSLRVIELSDEHTARLHRYIPRWEPDVLNRALKNLSERLWRLYEDRELEKLPTINVDDLL